MNIVRKSIFGAFLFLIVFYMISSGCTWITFTAKDRLTNEIALKSSVPVNSVYLEFSEPAEYLSITAEDFVERLKNKLIEKRYKLVTAPGDADLVAKFRIFCYKKRVGTLYFFLGLIPTGGIESNLSKIDGIKVSAIYITNKSKWKKTYRAYHGDIASAIIEDLNQIAITK